MERRLTKVQELIYELKISDVMKRSVITVNHRSLMSELREILKDKRISGTPVVSKDKLVGIISIEDLIKWLLEGSRDCTIEERMSPDVKTLYPDESLIHAISKFEEFGFGRFPVVDRDRRLVGIITKGIIIEGLLHKLEIDYHEEEAHRYKVRSRIFEDILLADKTTLTFQYHVKGKDFKSAGGSSSRLKQTLKGLGIHPDIVRRAAIATYEAEMNLVIYTDGGKILANVEPDKIQIKVEDSGPGIPDIQKALEPGYSTAPDWVRELGFGAGMGLTNIQRCADRMELVSSMEEGTDLEIEIKIR